MDKSYIRCWKRFCFRCYNYLINWTFKSTHRYLSQISWKVNKMANPRSRGNISKLAGDVISQLFPGADHERGRRYPRAIYRPSANIWPCRLSRWTQAVFIHRRLRRPWQIKHRSNHIIIRSKNKISKIRWQLWA